MSVSSSLGTAVIGGILAFGGAIGAPDSEARGGSGTLATTAISTADDRSDLPEVVGVRLPMCGFCTQLAL